MSRALWVFFLEPSVITAFVPFKSVILRKTSAIDEAGNINIYSAAELAWVANQVINGEKNFSGVTITLRKNIDLGARQKDDGTWEGPDWKPIIGFLDEIPEKKILIL